MDPLKLYEQRVMPLKRALKRVKRGQRVFVGTACAEPLALVKGLMNRADELHDVELLHFVTLGRADFTESRFDRRFRHNALFIGPNTREAVTQARADYTPLFMHEVEELFALGYMHLDVALIQVSPPDKHGWVSLGIGVDVARSAAINADYVIAQVNRYMPRTMGNTYLPVSKIDAFVEHDEPLLEYRFPQTSEVGQKIAEEAAKLVRDGDTLHVGYGHLPNEILKHLEGKKDLGLHTEAITDNIIELVEKGVITCQKKTHFPGRAVCTFCVGSKKVYDFVDLNPNFLFLPSSQVYDPKEIAKNDNLTSIGSAMEVDLTGQVSSESEGMRFYSGIGGRLDFLRGAAMSKSGRPIIVLPSTTKDGTASRIVHKLAEGASIIATRGDVHYVVTEYGVAYLHGKSIRERTMALISIAHPRFRAELLEQAKEKAYVYPDQILIEANQHLYPEFMETTATLKDGSEVQIRPIKPTDEVLLQRFFYSHSEETVYNRYFRPVRAMPHASAQGMVNLDYDRKMALVATTGPIGAERIVGVGRYDREEERDLAEVAYTVHEDYAGQGLGTVLQSHLAEYALTKGIKGFWAISFGRNKSMLAVFAKLGKYTKTVIEPGVWKVEHYFDE
ncbi:GNAT family N-acetyltransferase [Dethiosulfatarculus sandiegensis]|uniref:Acetyl-CoA hydrolase n=1 Tax=Dethiosulfatarculus sandiegensis TaxID=1429043 RepID=A0A0D2GMC3_9BACT|nr:GNAT family N-acetyltransferase [Dethiosulfatarculus sandiegensis]KIX15842.1 acetyl-CoA hydrolase [Dethiosulfatarculus sandiegensis]